MGIFKQVKKKYVAEEDQLSDFCVDWCGHTGCGHTYLHTYIDWSKKNLTIPRCTDLEDREVVTST